MKKTTDQMGRSVKLPKHPKRIISLVPSQTELLYDLGLRDEVIGITKFCVHPKSWFTTKTRIGGTKQYKLDLIDSLKPDLIIGNNEENDKTQIEILAKKYPVWMSDILTLDDALDMMSRVGELVNRSENAQELVKQVSDTLKVSDTYSSKKKSKAAYFIWKNPNMVAANQTFIHSMLELAGFENAFAHLERYPIVSDEDLLAAAPDVILLSSEPFPFQEKHFEDFMKVFGSPKPKIRVVDGELFSWYGSRLLKFASYFEGLKRI